MPPPPIGAAPTPEPAAGWAVLDCLRPLLAALFWPLRPPAASWLPVLSCVIAAMAVQVPRSVTYSTLETPGLPQAVCGPDDAQALRSAVEIAINKMDFISILPRRQPAR